jgi:hypothetical protein
MGPPLRSFAADAHGCIMVRVLGPTGYKVVARLIRADLCAKPPSIRPVAWDTEAGGNSVATPLCSLRQDNRISGTYRTTVRCPPAVVGRP